MYCGADLMKVGHSMTERHQQLLAEESGVVVPVPSLISSPRKWWHFRGCKLWCIGTTMFLAGNVAK